MSADYIHLLACFDLVGDSSPSRCPCGGHVRGMWFEICKNFFIVIVRIITESSRKSYLKFAISSRALFSWLFSFSMSSNSVIVIGIMSLIHADIRGKLIWSMQSVLIQVSNNNNKMLSKAERFAPFECPTVCEEVRTGKRRRVKVAISALSKEVKKENEWTKKKSSIHCKKHCSSSRHSFSLLRDFCLTRPK